MANEPTIDWPGQSGKTYTYWIYPVSTTFSSDPGNYVFAKKNQDGKWVPIYIGQTGDLSERFDNHHRKACIEKNSATHVHAHKNSAGEQARLDEETDIRRRFDPPCNKQ